MRGPSVGNNRRRASSPQRRTPACNWSFGNVARVALRDLRIHRGTGQRYADRVWPGIGAARAGARDVECVCARHNGAAGALGDLQPHLGNSGRGTRAVDLDVVVRRESWSACRAVDDRVGEDSKREFAAAGDWRDRDRRRERNHRERWIGDRRSQDGRGGPVVCGIPHLGSYLIIDVGAAIIERNAGDGQLMPWRWAGIELQVARHARRSGGPTRKAGIQPLRLAAPVIEHRHGGRRAAAHRLRIAGDQNRR